MEKISPIAFLEVSKFCELIDFLKLREVSQNLKTKVSKCAKFIRAGAEQRLQDYKNSLPYDVSELTTVQATLETIRGSLDRSSMTELRNYAHPPFHTQNLVRLAVMVARRLKSPANLTWQDCKTTLTDPNFITKLDLDFIYLTDPEVKQSLEVGLENIGYENSRIESIAASNFYKVLETLKVASQLKAIADLQKLNRVIDRLTSIEA